MTKDDCTFVIFATGERTIDLCKFSIEQLGYKNILTIENNLGFRDKYILMAEMCSNTNSKYIVRVDGDHIVYDGIDDLINHANENNYDWLTGIIFDYFMNNFRGGTPQVITKKVLDILNKDNNLMPNTQKPESVFSETIRSAVKMGDVRIFTALHEYEQYPGKVCNSFLNRLHRNHSHLYNNDHLNTLPEHYKIAINQGLKTFSENKNKNSMDFVDFSFLDNSFDKIKTSNIEILYKKYKNLYEEIKRGI
jgi:hypothetical protein